MQKPRRYLTVLQEREGYPGERHEPLEEGMRPPDIVAVVKVDDYEALEREHRDLLEYVAVLEKQGPPHVTG